MYRKATCVLLSFVLMFCSVPASDLYAEGRDYVPSSSETESIVEDTFRDNWMVTEDGTLRIWGEGSLMHMFGEAAPWHTYSSSIYRLEVESGITEIDFLLNCLTNLEEVSLPETLEVIGPWTFRNCTSLKEICIPSGVERICSEAFSGCTSLESVFTGSGTDFIESRAFSGCTSLKSVTLGTDTEIIGSYAFEGCTSLRNLALPRSLEGVGVNAFQDCTGLLDVWFYGPDTGKELILADGNDIPWCSETLLRHDLPWEGHFFSGAVAAGFAGDGIFWLLDNKGCLFINGEGAVADFTTDGNPWSLRYAGQFQNIVIEPGITRIGKNAFSNLMNITGILIPNSLESIGAGAFSGTSIQSVCFSAEEASYSGLEIAQNNDSYMNASREYCFDRSRFISAADEVKQYSYNNTTFSYYPKTRLLEIYGSDPIQSLSWNYGDWEWQELCQAETLVLSGTESISRDLLSYFTNLNTLVLKDTLQISENTFRDNLFLKDLYLPGDAAIWEKMDIAPGNMNLADAEIHYYKAESADPYSSEALNITGQGTFSDNIFWRSRSDGYLEIYGLGSVALPTGEGSEVQIPWDMTGSFEDPNNPEVEYTRTVSIGEGISYLAMDLIPFPCTMILPECLSGISEAAWMTDSCIKENSAEMKILYLGTEEVLTDNYSFMKSLLRSSDFSVVFSDFPQEFILESGTLNENISWSLTASGVLTISGEGKIPESWTPWREECGIRGMIRAIVVESGITSVGAEAFCNLPNLSSVLISDSVRVIRRSAFSDCENLKYISLPGRISLIGENAFYNCASLCEVYETGLKACDEAVTGTGNEALINAKHICVKFCDTNSEYMDTAAVGLCGDAAFWRLSDIGELIIYGTGYMSDCSRIRKRWPDGGESIRTITIGEDIDYIGSYAFSDLENVESVYISPKDFTVGTGAFASFYPETLLFSGAQGELSVQDTEGNGYYISAKNRYYSCMRPHTPSDSCIASCHCENMYFSLTASGRLYINDSNNSRVYTKDLLLENMEDRGSITSLILSYVVDICEYGFIDLPNIETVVLSEELQLIESYAFSNCTALKRVIFPGTPEEFRAICIDSGNDPLLQAELICLEADTDKRIAAGFRNGIFWELRESGRLTVGGEESGSMLRMPDEGTCPWQDYRDSVTSVFLTPEISCIGAEIFKDHTKLKTVIFSGNMTLIDARAFEGCDSIQNLIFYDGTDDQWLALKEQAESGLPSVPVVKNLIRAEAWAVMDSGVCGDDAVWTYSRNGTLTISGSGAIYDYEPTQAPWYSYREEITDLIVSGGITGVGSSAFFSCCYMQRASLPRSLTHIGRSAFMNCFSLNDIFYSGGTTEYGSISTDKGNDCLYTAVRHDFGSEIKKPAIIDGTFRRYYESQVLWRLTDDGTLIIDADGEMQDYVPRDRQGDDTPAPWIRYSSEIERVIVLPGLTSIGAYAFDGLDKMTEIILPSGLANIDENAFRGCYLKTVFFCTLYVNKDLKIETSDETSYICHTYFTFFGSLENSDINWEVTNSCLYIDGSGAIPDYSADISAPWKLYADAFDIIKIGEGITDIGSMSFTGCKDVSQISFTYSVFHIGEGAFGDCVDLKTVCYYGTEESYDLISICGNNKPLLNAEVVFEHKNRPNELDCLIKCIGEITYSSPCFERLERVRLLYEKLSPEEAKEVEYSSLLFSALNEFCELEKETPSFHVVLYSRIKGTDLTAAPLTGGGVYHTIRGADIAAGSTDSLVFIGWYENYGKEDEVLLDSAAALHINPERDYYLTAVYVPQDKALISVTISADSYLINEDGETYYDANTFAFIPGEIICITHTDDTREFLYWKDSKGNILGRSREIRITALTDMSISAVTVAKRAGGTHAFVYFEDGYGHVISTRLFYVIDTIEFPKPPSIAGKTFTGWSMTQTEIRKAMVNSSHITVTALYEQETS